MMRCITLTQPWASLIAIGAKTIETRSWHTNWRGDLAIHAAKGLGSVGGNAGLVDLCATEPFKSVLEPLWSPGTFFAPQSLPFGCVVAVCRLDRLRPTSGVGGAWARDLSDQERAFGDYSPNRWGWYLTDVRALPEPIPAKGALGLWDWRPPAGWTPPQ